MTPSAVLSLVVLLAGVPEQGSDRPATSAESSTGAEQLFRTGLDAYDAHDYVRAIQLFESAYAAFPKPEILFDIGQAYRATGNCRRAAASFDAFIRAVPPDDPLLPRARARQQELGSCAQDHSPSPAQSSSPVPGESSSAVAPVQSIAVIRSPQPPIEAQVLVSQPMGSPRSFGSALRTTCGVTGGAGLALATVGLILGLEARSAQHAVDTTTVWDAAAEREDARGQALGSVATALLISAGAAALGATATCSLGWRSRR